MMNTKDTDRMDATDSTAVAIGRLTRHNEAATVTGKYTARVIGPAEEQRARYIELRDELAAIAAADAVSRAQLSSREAALRSEFLGIPLEEKWVEDFHNLVTTVGGNDLLDVYMSGSNYNASWYMGLIGSTDYTTGPALTDTMGSHAGWAEATVYSNAARPAAAWSAAAGKSKSLSAGLVFNLNASTTIKGCFLTNNSTKGGTTGLLFSAGLFTGGDQPVVNGNTLTVTYSASV